MNRQKFDKIKRKLWKSSVGVAGAGGLGSNAAVALVRAGVGKLVIVDFDKVEKSNLDRQYYFLDQVGMLKVEALRDNIRGINPEVKVEIYNQKLKTGSMERPFHDVDVVIEALDDAQIKTEFIEEILLKLPDKPIVAASGVAGYGNLDRIVTRHFGKLYIVKAINFRTSMVVELRSISFIHRSKKYDNFMPLLYVL